MPKYVCIETLSINKHRCGDVLSLIVVKIKESISSVIYTAY